jgi:hypothetical protein
MLWLTLLVALPLTFCNLTRAKATRANGPLQPNTEPMSRLYWLYHVLAFSVLGVLGHIAKAKPTELGAWWLLAAVLFGAAIFARHALMRNDACASEIYSYPLVSKWQVRLIWLGSIAFFQALEFHRYLVGQSYRPFFALYTAVICAALVWFLVRVCADFSRQRQHRFHR